MERYSVSDVTLRPFETSDAHAAVQWYTDERVSKFSLWDTFPTNEAAIEHFLKYDMRHPWKRAICLSGRIVGQISARPFHGHERCRAELGYVIAPDYWGRGVGTQAVKMAAKVLFAEWGHLERLEAVVNVANVASQRVLEKAGFQREAILRKYYLLKGRPSDVVIYSLLASDAYDLVKKSNLPFSYLSY